MITALLLDILIKGTVLLIVAGTAAFAARHASAALRHLIWSTAAVGLLLLPAFTVLLPNWAVPGLARVTTYEAPPDAWVPPTLEDDAQTAVRVTAVAPRVAASPAGAVELRANETVGPVAVAGPAASAGPDAVSFFARARMAVSSLQMRWRDVVLTIWVVGSAVVLASIAFGLLQISWLAQSANVVRSGPLAAMVEDAAHQLALRQRVTLVISDRSVMPMTWGLSPRVLLPASANDWTDARIRAVLLHELAHVKRLDFITQLVARCASALYWFNPLVWFALSRMRIERELACDDLVLNSGSKASEYAEHLLGIARSLAEPRCATADGIALARRSRFSDRLLAILDATRRRADVTPVVSVSVGVVALSIVLPVATATVETRTPEEPLLRAPGILATLPSFPQPVAPQRTQVADLELPEFRWTSSWVEADISRVPTVDALFGETLAELGLSNAWASRPTVASEVWAEVIGKRAVVVRNAALCDWGARGDRSTSMNIDDDEMRVRIRRGDCRLEIDASGDIEFNDQETDIVDISRSGYFEIEERDGRERRRLEIRATSNGSLARSWRVNGDEQVYDAEARAWLGSLVPVIFRLTGIQAEERATRILDRSGPDGLLQEISLIASDYVARRYYEVLLNRGALDPAMMQRIVRQVAQDIDSDYELAELLIAVAREHPADEGVRIAYVEAAGSISSDFEHRRVLSAILDRPLLSQEVANAMLASATAIDSDYELASLLIQIAESHPIDEVLTQAYFDAANTITSDYEHRRVLHAALTAGAPSQSVLDRALESGINISSDHELANLLNEVARLYPVERQLPQSYLAAARTIDSDFELGRVLKGLVRRDTLSATVLASVIELAAGTVSSDHEMAEFLLAVLAKHRVDAATRQVFFAAVRTLDSDFEHNRILTRVVSEQPLDDATVQALLESALGISSDVEMANLLVKVVRAHPIGDSLRPAFMRAADSIGSTYERGRVLSALMPRAN